MKDTHKQTLTVIFQYLCIVCAIFFTCQSIQRFALNKDMTEISFREYHETKDDIYPSTTFCHLKPFILDKLQRYNKNLTISGYKRYLAGKYGIGNQH